MLDPAPEPQLHLYERPEPAPFEAGHAQSCRALCRTIILAVSHLKRVQRAKSWLARSSIVTARRSLPRGVKCRCQSAPISKTLCRHPARRFTRHAAARSIDDAGDITREVRGKHVPAIRQRCMGGHSDGGLGSFPSAASGAFPFHVAFVDDRLLCAVNPRWGYTRRIFRKIRFLFLSADRRRACPLFFGK